MMWSSIETNENENNNENEDQEENELTHRRAKMFHIG